MSSSCFSPSTHSFLPAIRKPYPKLNSNPTRIRCSSSFSDPFVLEIAEKLEDSLSLNPAPSQSRLQKLRDLSSQSLLSQPWPTLKTEEFRFTDLSFLKNYEIAPVTPSNPDPALELPSDFSNVLTILNGRLIPSLSRAAALPAGAFTGSIADLPSDHKAFSLLADRFTGGDLFFDLNGVGAADVAVVYVPAGGRISEEPVYLRFCYDGGEVGDGRLPISNPRVLVLAERGAELAIVEEHFGVNVGEVGSYWANSVMEIVVEENAKVSHSYLQQQSGNSAHVKWTFTRQEASSGYELIEVSTGGKLSRHNLHIEQLGPDTMTELSAFHVAHEGQTQDLHSRLVLNHPGGYSRQLHKCIVSHSTGHAVFDGNIKVNRLAQQTDAGQLTRTLLLARKATVNLKPNLQIIADDVKCSHGAAISDLEEDQLFYFQARGIDVQAAREALVFSFGAEVFNRIPFESFRKSVSSRVKEVLSAR